MLMTIKVRMGDLDTDRDTAITLLSTYVNPQYDRRRFQWLYRRNPAGAGRLWVAVDGSTGDPVGMAGAFPRRMYAAGTEVLAWVLGDFCVSEQHRALGPALQLQRACLEDLTAEGMPFCYDFPGRSMEAVYRRLGIARRGQLLRLARPLRVRRKLQQRWGASLPVRAVSAVADLMLAYGIRRPRAIAPVVVTAHTGPCGDEFSALARLAGPRYGTCVIRSAGYLDWRYRENPIRSHQMLIARLHGVLAAYAVLTREDDGANIVDLFGIPDPAIIRALVRHVLSVLWNQGCTTVSASLPELHPLTGWLPRLGFRPRAAAPIALYAPESSAVGVEVIKRADWFLTDGDRDG
jgi:hypothetical protein